MNKSKLLLIMLAISCSSIISAQSLKERANKIYKSSIKQVNRTYNQFRDQVNRKIKDSISFKRWNP